MHLIPEEVLLDNSSDNFEEENFWELYPPDFRFFINAYLREDF